MGLLLAEGKRFKNVKENPHHKVKPKITLFTNIYLLFYIFVFNHLKTEIKLNYILQAKFVPRSKHTPTGF
jgi:hypothetical protein